MADDKNIDAFEASIDPELQQQQQVTTEQDAFEAAITPKQVNGELTQERWSRMAGAIYNVLDKPNEMAMIEGMPDAKLEAQNAAKERAVQLTAQFQSAIQNRLQIVSTPEEAERVLGEALAQQQALQQREQEPLQVERTYVEMTAEEVDRDIVFRMAAREAAVNLMAEAADERDWLDKTGDFFTSTFLPAREIWDNDDVVQEIAKDPTIAHIAGDDLSATARRFAQLSGEEQLAVVPAIHEAVLRAVDNHLLFYDTNPNVDVAMSIINALFSASPDERVQNLQLAGYADIAFDVATMGTTAVVGNRVLKGVGAAANAAKTGEGALAAGKALAAELIKKATGEELAKSSVIGVAAGAGNLGKAAKMGLMAMLDKDIARRMGVTDVDMALQALPHPTAEWYREQIADPNMTGEMLKELQTSVMQAAGQALAMKEAKEAMMFGALTPDSQRKAQDTWLEKAFPKLQADYLAQGYILENPRIVTGDHKGFKFEYTIRRADDAGPEVPPASLAGAVPFNVNGRKVTPTFDSPIDKAIAAGVINGDKDALDWLKSRGINKHKIDTRGAIIWRDIQNGVNHIPEVKATKPAPKAAPKQNPTPQRAAPKAPPAKPATPAPTAQPQPTPAAPQQPAPRTTPKGAATGVPVVNLPKELAGAKVRYAFGPNSIVPIFENPVDMAIYIATSPTQSKRKQAYIDFLREERGLWPTEIEARGKAIRDYLKPIAKKGDVTEHRVPAGDLGVDVTPTGEGAVKAKPSKPQQPSKQEQKQVTALAETGSLEKAMEGFKKTDASKALKIVADRVLQAVRQMQKQGTTFTIAIAGQGKRNLGAGTRGVTDAFVGRNQVDVVLNPNAYFVGTSYDTLVHEAVHSVTMHMLTHGDPSKLTPAARVLRQEMDDLFQHVKKVLKERQGSGEPLTEIEGKIQRRTINAMADIDELLAHGLTNPEFQDLLKRLPSQKESVWNRFVKILAKALGIEGNQQSALTDLLEKADRLFKAAPDEPTFAVQRGASAKSEELTPTPGRGIAREGEVTYRISDETGTFTATANDKVYQDYGNVLSPSAASVRTEKGDFNYEVAIQGVMGGVEASTVERLTNFARWAMKPVSGIGKAKARARVDQAILAGDEYVNANGVSGRTFTVTELINGVDYRGVPVKLTDPDEIKAYYRYRAFADAMQSGENYVMLRELELGGFKDVKLNIGDVRDPSAWKVFAKPLEAGHAKRVAAKARGEGVFSSNDGKVVDLTPELVEEIYEAGDKLVRIKGSERNGGWNTKGTGDLDVSGERVQWARVKDSQIRELGHRMPVPYKHGYAPKVNQGEWAVKMAVPVKTRGRSVPDRTQVSRLFDSLEDAKRFREEQIQKSIARRTASGDATEEEARKAAERLWPEVENVGNQSVASRIEEAVGPHGGLFSGHRSKDELLFGVRGEKADRISPLSLMGRYTSHMAGILTRNEQRIGAEKRWLNTVAEIFPEVPQRGFGATIVDDNTKAGRALNRMKREIEEWNAIPTVQENWLQALVQKLHDRALYAGQKFVPGMQNKESIKSLMWLKHSNPINALKAANMHLFMGALNPRQIYMQASAALIAMSKHPTLTPRALENLMYVSILDNVRNDTALGKVSRMLLKDEQLTPEFSEMYEAWRRSGLYEGMFANADWAKFSTDGLGVAADTMRKMGNVSLAFYRAGEGFNRRMSFLIEYENWRRTTGKVKPTEEELQSIIEEAQKNMIQLERYNRAWWQGGSGTGMVRQISGLATQFMQVPMKTMELVMRSEGRGGFTAAQRARVFASQALLFGTAGIPAGTFVVAGMGKAWEWATGEGLNIDPEVANVVNQGFSGFVVNTLMGTDLNIAGSIAPAAGSLEMIKDIVMSEDPLYVKALGASYNGVLGRGWEAYANLQALSFYDRTGEEDLTPEQLKLGLMTLGSMFSTGRNFFKSRIMREHHKLLSNRGRVIEERDFDNLTEIGVLWGLRTRSEDMLWDYRNWERSREEEIRDMVDARVNIMHKAIYAMDMDPQKLKALRFALQVSDEIMDEDMKQQVRERVDDIIFDNSGEGGEIGKAVHKYLNSTLADALNRDAAEFTLGGIRNPQQTLPDEE